MRRMEGAHESEFTLIKPKPITSEETIVFNQNDLTQLSDY